MNIWDELSKVYNMPGIPDEAMSIIGDVMLAWSEGQEGDTISRNAAIDAGLRLCGMDTKMELINLCEASIADSEGRAGAILDYIGELEDLPAVQPERTCVNCGRTANNGGWYADGRTRCPIEEHYALPKDGYCHLWEKRNVTDDDYPERREE